MSNAFKLVYCRKEAFAYYCCVKVFKPPHILIPNKAFRYQCRNYMYYVQSNTIVYTT